jgi:hypothetical protein
MTSTDGALVDAPTKAPVLKVWFATLGAALGPWLVAFVQTLFTEPGFDVSDPATWQQSVVAALLALAFGYLKRNRTPIAGEVR